MSGDASGFSLRICESGHASQANPGRFLAQTFEKYMMRAPDLRGARTSRSGGKASHQSRRPASGGGFSPLQLTNNRAVASLVEVGLFGGCAFATQCGIARWKAPVTPDYFPVRA